MAFKSSMFNHYVENEDEELVLYNSLQGTSSIRLVGEEKREKIKEWIDQKGPMEEQEDPDFQKLVEYGYLIPPDRDEKALREMKYMERIMDPTLYLVVHTTGACNFRCQYCAADFDKKAMPREIQDSLIRFVRRNINKYNRVMISWFGGEPLLEMEVIDYVSQKVMEICRKAHKPYTAAVTSNGYLLSPRNLEILIRSRVIYYTITVDGLKETHDLQRFLAGGGPSFDVIIENLRFIRDHIKNQSVHVNIRTNVTREILEILPEYYAFYDKEFGMDPRFSLFVRLAGDWGGDRVKKMHDSLMDIRNVGQIYRALMKLDGSIKFYTNFSDLEFAGASCLATLKHKYTIGTEGQITKCDDSDFEYLIGRLLPDGGAEIDEAEEARWVTGHRRVSKGCGDCYYSGACMENCCPKNGLIYSHHDCGFFFGVDDLLLLAAKSLNVEKI